MKKRFWVCFILIMMTLMALIPGDVRAYGNNAMTLDGGGSPNNGGAQEGKIVTPGGGGGGTSTHSHSWSGWSSTGDSSHKRTCRTCGATETWRS